MLHVFIDDSALNPLLRREFLNSDGKRMDWVVDLVLNIATYAVKFDSYKNIYEVTESVRDDRGDWRSYQTGVKLTDISIAEADDTARLLKLINDDNTENKGIYLGLLLARQVEDYLYEIGFWASNKEPDEHTGGVLISAVDDELRACVVFGKDRPDMKYVPFKVSYKDVKPFLQRGEHEMGRPYEDELVDKLKLMFKDALSDTGSQLFEGEDSPWADENDSAL